MKWMRSGLPAKTKSRRRHLSLGFGDTKLSKLPVYRTYLLPAGASYPISNTNSHDSLVNLDVDKM